jgi:hypothetical protein
MWVSLNGYKAQLLIVRKWKFLRLPNWSHETIYCVLCVGLPHCQHSAAPLLFSCTVTFAPSVYKTGYSNVIVLLWKITWDRIMVWEEGELRYIQIVYGVKCLVKITTMERTCRHIWDIYIKHDVWQILCMFLFRCLELGINFRCFTKYKLVSSIRVGSVISGFCK